MALKVGKTERLPTRGERTTALDVRARAAHVWKQRPQPGGNAKSRQNMAYFNVQ